MTSASHDGKYRLVSGLVLAGDPKVRSHITEYLSDIKEKRAIAKVVYRNVVSPSNLQSTGGYSHLENRYGADHFYLVDSQFAQ